ESAADTYGDRVLGVILTGASNDGAQGIAKIKSRGGLAVVQEPTTADSPVMPKAAISALQQQCEAANIPDTRDWIMPLHDIAPFIVKLCHPVLR
ncbi:MAG TPA: chemotaxis protein CheB, partial [Coleofasciculaceae cyanobacterium]